MTITTVMGSRNMTITTVIEFNSMTMITVIQLGGDYFLDDSFTVMTFIVNTSSLAVLRSSYSTLAPHVLLFLVPPKYT